MGGYTTKEVRSCLVTFFFFAEYQFYYEALGHLRTVGGGGDAYPLHPLPRSAPGYESLRRGFSKEIFICLAT